MPTKRKRTIRRSDADAGASLRKPRWWYSDDGDGDDSPPENDNKSWKVGKDEIDLDSFESLDPELKQHILALRGEAKGHRLDKRDLRQEVSELKGKMTTLEESRKTYLERQGNFEELSREQEQELAELRLKAEKADRLEQSVKESNEKRIAKIPENMRSLVPEASPESTSAWLDTNETKLTAPPIPDLDGGAGGRGKGGRSTAKLSADEKKMAAAVGMTEDEYAARK